MKQCDFFHRRFKIAQDMMDFTLAGCEAAQYKKHYK